MTSKRFWRSPMCNTGSVEGLSVETVVKDILEIFKTGTKWIQIIQIVRSFILKSIKKSLDSIH
jgi:hypothetical protein